MAEIKYNGSTINSVVSQITNIAGKFDPVSNSVKTSTGLMVGRRGFDLINPGISADSISQSVGTCSEALGALVKEIRTKQVAILTYSQDKDEINAFVNSLSRLEYDNLDLSGIDSKISGWTKLSFAAKGLFASAGTFLTGFVEGAANFVETAVDTAAVVATGAASIFTKPYDLITGSNVTDEMWASTKAYVAEEQVASIADQFYANTEAGQWLKQNAYGFDTVRGIGKGVGYSTTMIMAGSVFAGAGGVDAAVKGARLAKALPAMSGVLGFGNGAEEGWANGASTTKGLMYGAASGTWESIQWGVGVKIGSLGSHIDDIATVGAKQVFKDASKRVVLDTVDSGLEGFVQPALTMIYKQYDGDTLAAQYANAFEANGGWNGVLQQAAIGGIMSGASEAGDVFKYNRNAAKIKKSGGGSSGSGSDASKTATVIDEKSDTVLKGKGKKETEARVEVQETSGVVANEVAPVDATPKKVVDEVGKNPVDTTPKKPVEAIPSKPADTTAKKPVEATASRTADTTAKKSVEVTSSEPVTTPSKPVATTSRLADPTPSKPVATTSRPVDPTPSKTVATPSRPVDPTLSKTVVTAPSSPVTTTPVRTTDTGAGAKIDTPGTQPASLAAGISSLVGDATGGKISGGDISKAGVGMATMAGLGKLGTSMSAVTAMGSDVDIDVDVKFTGDTGATPSRTSKQLSGDLEKMSAALPGKQAKVDAAEANLAKYKSEAGDAADPKVVKKLEGEVSKATADRDKQLEKMKSKAEQRSATATKEIDEKLASGSKKGLVGTEKGKLVDGEFTKDSAKTVGKIDKKEFSKLLDQEYGKVDRSKVDEFGNPIEPKVEAEATQGGEKVEVKQETPVTEVKTEVQAVSEDVRTELGITDSENYDSLATKIDKAVADGKLAREQGDSLFDTIAEEQHFDTKEQIADLRRENAEYEQARRDNVERKDLLVTQDGAKPESVKGYDEAVRQIDEKLATNNAKIKELEAGMETKTDVKNETPVTEVKKETPVTEVKKETPVTEVKQETPVTEVKKETPVTEVKQETPVTEVKTEVQAVSEDVRTELGITDSENYDSLATKIDKAVADGKLAREQGDSLFDTIAEEQHFDTKEQIADLRRENAEYEQARRDNVERKDLLVTQDGAKPESVKGYDEAVRQIDEKIATNNAKIKELEAGMEVRPDTLGSKLTTDIVEPKAVALGNTGAAVATVGNLGGGMIPKGVDTDVTVKTNGGDVTSTRTSKQLGADLEKLSAGLSDKQTKLDTAKANLDKYKIEMGDAADPKVVKKLEDEVNKAQTEYDKQLAKVKDKAEQRNATAAREIDDKLASGSKKGLVGTEKGRLVDGEFTKDTAITKGEISKKEFATEPVTRDSLTRTEGEVDSNVPDAGKTVVEPVADDIRSELGITDNETYDSLATKVEQAVADGKITREQADDIFYKAAEEQHFDTKDQIEALRKENAEYEQARRDNIERKELLVTEDGAKAESVKGYDEAVRQIDDKIAANKAKIAELEAGMGTKPEVETRTETSTEVKTDVETNSSDLTVRQETLDDGTVVETRLDEDGKVVQTTEKYSDGTSMTREVAADGTVVETDFDANGKIVKEVTTSSATNSKTETTYDKDGNVVNKVTEKIDNNVETTSVIKTNDEVLENGSILRHEELSDGTLKNTIIDKDGKVVRETEKYSDGKSMIREVDADGTVVETDFDAEGKVTYKTEEFVDGTSKLTTYNESGTMINRFDTEGNSVELTLITKDGTVRTQSVNPDGTVLKHIVEPDGMITDTILDKDGKVLSREIKPGDGTKAEAERLRLEEEARVKAEQEAEAERLRLEEEARVKAEQEAEAERLRLEEEARVKAEQEAEAERLRLEEEARVKAEQEAEAERLRLEEEARVKAEQEAEAERLRLEEEARIKAEQEAEAERLRLEEEARIKAEQEAEAERLRLEEEARVKAEQEAEAERLRLEEEARVKAEQEAEAERLRLEKEAEAERLRLEEEARVKAEQEAEAERLRLEEEARIKAEQEAEAERLRLEEEARVKAEQEAEAERLRLEKEAEAERLRLEEEARVKAEQEAEAERLRLEEEARIKAEQEAEAERLRLEEEARVKAEQEAEAERLRLEKEAEAERLRLEEEARVKAEQEAEAERLRLEEEARIKAEQEAEAERLRLEEEARVKAEQEAEAERLRLEEEARIKAEQEAEAERLRLEEEARVKAEQEAEAERLRLEEEARVKAEQEAEAERLRLEEEARVKAEQEAEAERLRLEEEARVKAEQEAEAERLRLEEEARIRAEEEERTKVNPEEELGRLAKERDAELDRIAKKRESDIAEAEGARRRQRNLEEGHYGEEVERLKKQFSSHDLDLGVYRSDLDVKYTELELKQRYETMYSDRFRELEMQHQRRLDLIDDGYRQTIQDINSRYQNDEASVKQLFTDLKGQVDRGELAGTALGAKKLISDYDRFVREQSSYEADRIAIHERYAKERSQIETAYRDHMNSSDNFHEQAHQMVKRGEMEPTYYLERSIYSDICDRVGVRKLEMFFDSESSFVRRIHDEDANFVLQQRNSRLYNSEARMQQELRDLELRYKESGFDVTDTFRKYELAIESDGLTPDALRGLKERLELDESLSFIRDDVVPTERIAEIRKGLDDKIALLEGRNPTDVNPGAGDLTVRQETLDDGTVVDTVVDKSGNVVEKTERFTDGTYTTHKVEADGTKVETEFDAEGNMTYKTEEFANGTTTTTAYRDSVTTVTKSDAEGNTLETTITSNDGTVRQEIVNQDGTISRYTMEPNGTTTTTILDEDGIVIKKMQEFEDGTSTLYRVEEDGTTFETDFDAEGNIIKEVTTSPETNVRTEITYDKDGNIVNKVTNNIDENVNPVNVVKTSDESLVDGSTLRHEELSDGTLRDTVIDKDGNVLETTEKYSDGKYTTHKVEADGTKVKTDFDAEGKMTYKTEEFADGTSMLTTYDENGTMTNRFDAEGNSVEMTITTNDGTVRQEIVNPDGTLSRYMMEPNGTTTTTILDKDGFVIKKMQEFEDGSSTLYRVEEDGTIKEITLDSNATVIGESVTYTNGLTTKYEIASDGTTINSTVDADGNVLYKKELYSNGTSRTELRESDGSSKVTLYDSKDTVTQSTITRRDGSVSTSHYDADGNVTMKTDVSADGRVKITENVDGTYEKITFDENHETVERTWKTKDGVINSEKINSDGTTSRHTVDEANGLTRDLVVDKDGNIVEQIDQFKDGSSKTYKQFADGTSQTAEYNIDGTNKITTLDANGNIKEMSWKDSKGIVRTQTLNPDGSKNYRIDKEDGSYEITTIAKDGTILTQSWKTVDGADGTKSFSPDGTSYTTIVRPDNSKTETVIRTDGSYKTTEYDSNNNIIGTTEKSTKGTVVSHRFNEDGSQVETIYRRDGTACETKYNTDGDVISQTDYRADGTISRVSEYNVDGSSKVYEYDTSNKIVKEKIFAADGSNTIIEYDGNGKITFKEISNPDGTSTKFDIIKGGRERTLELDADGNLIRGKIVSPDGSYHTREVSEGITTDVHYNVEGTKYYQKEVFPDKTVREINLDADGKTTIEMVTTPDKVKTTTTYAEDGSFTKLVEDGSHKDYFEYDKDGNVIRKVEMKSDGTLIETSGAELRRMEAEARARAEEEARFRAEEEARIKAREEAKAKVREAEAEARRKRFAELDEADAKRLERLKVLEADDVTLKRKISDLKTKKLRELAMQYDSRKLDLELHRQKLIDDVKAKADADVKQAMRSFFRRDSKVADIRYNASREIVKINNDIDAQLSSLNASYQHHVRDIDRQARDAYLRTSQYAREKYAPRVEQARAVIASDAPSVKEVKAAIGATEDEIIRIESGSEYGYSGRSKQELTDTLTKLRAKEREAKIRARDRAAAESRVRSASKDEVSRGAPKYVLGKDRSALSTETIVDRVRDMGVRTEADTAAIDAQVRDLASRFGITEDEMRVELDKKLRSFIEGGEVGRRTGISTLEKCLDSGYTKSQFETGTSGGAIGWGDHKSNGRAQLEQKMFGLDMDTPFVDRPVYGMIFPKEDGALRDYIYNGPGSWYGGTSAERYDITKKCVIIFDKGAIGDRTSITLGDSLDYKKSVYSSTLNDPHFSGAFSGFADNIHSLDDFRRADITKLFSGSVSDGYLECQMHGQSAHAINDTTVKEVIFPVEPSKELQEKLKKANIPWRVL